MIRREQTAGLPHSPAPARSIKVVFFQRKRTDGVYSLERVFENVRSHLPKGFVAEVKECPWPSVGVLPRMRNMLWARRNQGDINHVTGDVHYLTLFLRKDRTVLTIPDCVSLEYSRGIKRFLLWLFWFWLPVRRAAIMTTISEFTRREVIRYTGCPPEKVVSIHCPVSPLFKPYPKKFNSERPTILQVGTTKNKNLERIACALEGISCRLVIVGRLSDEQRAELEHHGIEYTHHFNLTDGELLDLYRACDLVIFASLYEGFGLPIVEAQAVGRPVITSNRCSMPEVAGGAAHFVDPQSAGEIRLGVTKLLGDAECRSRLVEMGSKNVGRFMPREIAVQYAAWYHKLASSEC